MICCALVVCAVTAPMWLLPALIGMDRTKNPLAWRPGLDGACVHLAPPQGDISARAVLLTACSAALIGLLTLWPYLGPLEHDQPLPQSATLAGLVVCRAAK
ncbi:MAG: hypothetical protein ABL901_02505 [Hyphomicrobiaceae bacterium]